ncbi:MAG: hypothetical protein IT257_04165 [Chitinophagaceae bacterium]|nr:hypothetical protein [Chitinophagaceae bacterium]
MTDLNMQPTFIIQDDSLILPGLSKKGQALAILRLASPALAAFMVIQYIYLFPGAFWVITGILYYSFRPFIFKPMVFSAITLRKHPEGLLIGQQLMRFEDMLFLSLRERDHYAVIRLEGKRDTMLKANETILKTDCRSFEEACDFCLQLRAFIHPGLRINHIKIGYGRGAYEADGEGARNENVEVWEYL